AIQVADELERRGLAVGAGEAGAPTGRYVGAVGRQRPDDDPVAAVPGGVQRSPRRAQQTSVHHRRIEDMGAIDPLRREILAEVGLVVELPRAHARVPLAEGLDELLELARRRLERELEVVVSAVPPRIAAL